MSDTKFPPRIWFRWPVPGYWLKKPGPGWNEDVHEYLSLQEHEHMVAQAMADAFEEAASLFQRWAGNNMEDPERADNFTQCSQKLYMMAKAALVSPPSDRTKEKA